ncbi:thiamine diphosphokinase [Radiobacillus kanasensis]|uniref:thiamine diphosphokinase n=1 Tax=Radiobacillus kanasensis TaxID=2844358 RepID=UPI001E42A5ED|nr:thiamine diphosphokinase [Radiobacillus kanasensis]UFU00986.1 thiamine diphosphokinase [Radiobacillus kanasensis]
MERIIGIVAGGPKSHLPTLTQYESQVTTWIGVDRGAFYLIEKGISPNIAIGDFDSVSESEQNRIMSHASEYLAYPIEKDETDLELAVEKAVSLQPDSILFFGVTGGRLDHSLANVQLLMTLWKRDIPSKMVDAGNVLEIKGPGKHIIEKDDNHPNVSFIPFTEQVIGISLDGFYYKLTNRTISWGSTLCISNKLISEKGTFSFKEGILIVIKSRDVQ